MNSENEIKKFKAEITKLQKEVAKYKYCPMTNLKGRKDFNDRLDELWYEFQSFESPFMLGIIDLNGLHAINRNQGFLAGDEFIIRTAEVIQRLFPCSGIYRSSGDEFFILRRGTDCVGFEEKLTLIDDSEYGTSCTIHENYIEIEAFFNHADGEVVNKKNKRGEQKR